MRLTCQGCREKSFSSAIAFINVGMFIREKVFDPLDMGRRQLTMVG
ncbi:hypothetical protein [Cyanobacterium aponinum]|nr:hypothetical protein [Cyanobacterium aponinum]